MGDDDELSLLGLDKGGDILDTVGEGLAGANFGWSKGLLRLLSGGLKALLVLFLALWAILLEETEDLDSGGLVKGVVELVHGWWNFKTLHEDAALALEADILRPLDAGCGVWGDISCFVGEKEFLLLDITIENDLLWLRSSPAGHEKGRPQPPRFSQLWRLLIRTGQNNPPLQTLLHSPDTSVFTSKSASRLDSFRLSLRLTSTAPSLLDFAKILRGRG